MKIFAFHHNKNLKRNVKVSTLLLLSLLSACGKPSQNSNSEYLKNLNNTYPSQAGGTLIDATIGEPSGLIAMVAGESAAAAISSNIFNKLLKYDKNLDIEGELAQSWQVSADQKTITFKLKPNLKWADGKPLTSEDVLWTWQAVIDEKTGSPYASDYQLVKKAEAPDPLTFSVTYQQAYAPALDSWSGLQILPKHLIKGQDLHTTAFARNPVGSSYYQLESWTHGESLMFSPCVQLSSW